MMITMPTIAQAILIILKYTPDLTQAQISERLCGRKLPQLINGDVTLMVSRGAIECHRRPYGRLIYRLPSRGALAVA
jgi:hypothetical protein